MATSPNSPASRPSGASSLFDRARAISLGVLGALFLVCLFFSWNTGASVRGFKGKAGVRRTIVDLTPWQTAQTLSALAVTTEEIEYAQDALHLADHAVDQAFASALRKAALLSAHRPDTPAVRDALKKVQDLQDIVAQDQSIVDALNSALTAKPVKSKDAQPDSDVSDDLDVAKAQLALDSSELVDAQSNLDRASGDSSSQIQQELNAQNDATKEFDDTGHVRGEVTAVSVRRRSTLASRVSAWFAQIDRNKAVTQAQQQALDSVATLTRERADFEAKTDKMESQIGLATGRKERLSSIHDRSTARQILDIYDDRIQTSQQLAAVYGKWSAQIDVQHSIVGRLILQSFSYILLIAIGALLLDVLIRQVMDTAALERRQSRTLHSILTLGVQVLAVLAILLVIFGLPQETSTILGLGTAALTIALQDFIIAFLGWFVLVGKHGIHVGDWVEINGVGGEVTEIGLFSTSLLETGTLEDKGHPTGRRITFMNGYAIRGTYFNFSTSGQWMWDEISVTIPPETDTTETVERIHKLVLDATQQNSQLAEQEWKRGSRGEGLGRFSAEPIVNLRPSPGGIGTQVRYVTRASERFELRNRLYQQIVELLQNRDPLTPVPSAS